MKHIAFLSNKPAFRCSWCAIILAFSWIAGLLCGLFFVSKAAEPLSLLMHTAVYNHITLFGLAAVLFLPLIASAAAVYLGAHILIFPICFIKSFAFGVCLCGVSVAFGSAGWLVRVLLLFSDSCMIVVLLWFWYRHLTGDRSVLRRDTVLCAAVALFVGLVDYLFVSPFFAGLLI